MEPGTMGIVQSAPGQYWVIQTDDAGIQEILCGPFENRADADDALREITA